MEAFLEAYKNLQVGAPRQPSPPVAVMDPPYTPIECLDNVLGFIKHLARISDQDCPDDSGYKKEDDKVDEVKGEDGGMTLNEYFRRRADGMDEKEVARWSEILEHIELLGYPTKEIQNPTTLLYNPVLLLQLSSFLSSKALMVEVANRPGYEQSPASAFASIDSTYAHSTYGDSNYRSRLNSSVRAFEPASAPQNPVALPRSLVSLPPTTPRFPRPSVSIHLNGETYIGLERASQAIPGFHVNILDVQSDGSNQIARQGKLWLKLRIVRERGRWEADLLANAPPPPVLGRGSGQVRGVYGQRFRGHAQGGSGAQPGFIQHHFQSQAPAPAADPVLIGNDYYAAIGQGSLRGCFVCRKGAFCFGGVAWVKEFLVVPVEDEGMRQAGGQGQGGVGNIRR